MMFYWKLLHVGADVAWGKLGRKLTINEKLKSQQQKFKEQRRKSIHIK